MYRYLILIAVSVFASLNVNAGSIKDSAQNSLIDRIVSGIAAKCQLSDPTKKELSTYFFSYYLKIKKIRSDPKKEMSCLGDLRTLKNNFSEGLKKKFGECVYKCYKKFTEDCVVPVRKENKLNRITEGTNE